MFRSTMIEKRKPRKEIRSLEQLEPNPNSPGESNAPGVGGCRENFNHYLVNTTLHGLKYVGDRKITRPER